MATPRVQRKGVLLVFDGLGDRPIPELGNRTPLEAARTPNLDRLATQGICGQMYPLGIGRVPGSDVAHLALFGYDPDKIYSGRGPIEAAGVGIELRDGDVAFRGNFGTIDSNGVILDRRAGRIRVVKPLTEALDGWSSDGVEVLVKPGTAHRAVVVLRGENLSAMVSEPDPHITEVAVREAQPLDASPEAARTAAVLNKFLSYAGDQLRRHPLNEERKSRGELEANYLLVRGAGQHLALKPFSEKYGMRACCIAGGGLYKGIGAYLGMTILDVPGATALPDSNVEAKFRTLVQALAEFDFAFVHVKATDSLGEDGNWQGKHDFIEKADVAAKILVEDLPSDVVLTITGDHSTPCEFMMHSADAVPFLMTGPGVRVDSCRAFGERECQSGGLGALTGLEVMPHILTATGRAPFVGA